MTRRGFRRTDLLFLAACCLLVALGLLLAKLEFSAGIVAAVGLVLGLFELLVTLLQR